MVTITSTMARIIKKAIPNYKAKFEKMTSNYSNFVKAMTPSGVSVNTEMIENYKSGVEDKSARVKWLRDYCLKFNVEIPESAAQKIVENLDAGRNAFEGVNITVE